MSVKPRAKPLSVKIADLQRALSKVASADTKKWWDDYLKGAIPFRGVKMAGIREQVANWYHARNITELGETEQVDHAIELVRCKYAEDKLAGILLLQEYLIPRGQLRWHRDLPKLAALFDEQAISDWNTCDWFCVRVLGPLIERNGKMCARAIAGWKSADSLWQRRASGVAFVNLAQRGEDNFIGFVELLLDVCAHTLQSKERFAQTGTGWVLRELGVAEPARVVAFVDARLEQFTREGLRYAIEKMPDYRKQQLLDDHAARLKSAAK